MDSLADLVPLGRWTVRLRRWFRTFHWTRIPTGTSSRRCHFGTKVYSGGCRLQLSSGEFQSTNLYPTTSSTRMRRPRAGELRGIFGRFQGLGLHNRQPITSMSWNWSRFFWRCMRFGRVYGPRQFRSTRTTPLRWPPSRGGGLIRRFFTGLRPRSSTSAQNTAFGCWLSTSRAS